jgi:Rhodopirellula transposase DDE domain
VRHGSICSRCRTEDEAIFRLAVGAGSTLLCGRRGGPAGAWRGQVYRAERGRRSANHASWPPRPRGGRGGSSGAHPHTGGGRPPRAVTPPLLEANLRPLWQECTAGAPMRAGVLWAHLSLREVSRRRWALGTPARRRPIRRLRKRTRGRRTARKKKTLGHPPDRNAPCDKNACRRHAYEAAGEAVLATDTPKKAWLGHVHLAGPPCTAEPVAPCERDGGAAGQGKRISHGLDAMMTQHAHLYRTTRHAPSAWRCDRGALWWEQAGRAAPPQAPRLLGLGDGGGSPSAPPSLCKDDLQGLAHRLGLAGRVAHSPPYCAKPHPIAG